MNTRLLLIPTLLFSFIVPLSHVSAQVNVTNDVVAANVTLVWEAQTYTPPFYKGKALLPDGGDVKILAFPPINLGNPYQLSYIWKVDGEVQASASGLGRSFFVYRSDIFGGSPLIIAEVSRDGTQVATGVIRVPLVKPRVLLYPSLPLGGILFGNQVSAAQGEEMTLEAYPLFFSVKSKSDPALTYAWRVNGQSVQNPLGNTGRIVVRSESGGDSTLKLTLFNEHNILETADGTMTLTFEE